MSSRFGTPASVTRGLGLLLLLLLLPFGSAKGQDDLFFEDDLDALLDGDGFGAEEPGAAKESSALRSWKGYMEFKPRVYLRDRDKGRKDQQAILKGELEFDFEFDKGRSAYFRPRIYIDLLNGDDNRFDPYEAYVTLEREGWDLRAGQFVENWGIVDTYNPLDVINRRDLGTDFLEVDRQGEIGVRYRHFLDGGETLGEPTVSLYALPIWQATRFPSQDHR
ncbi:MAG: hypothetical protein ACI9F9_001525, partial [Candidatus Paceibacteria bacterium]